MTINCFINLLETLNLTRTIGVTIYCYEINLITTSKSRALMKQLIVMDQLWHLVRSHKCSRAPIESELFLIDSPIA
jgi:hypothetical protein